MECVEKPEDSSAVSADIVVDDPAFLIITAVFVVGLIGVLVERVGDAFLEDVFGVFGARGTLCSWNCA